MITACPKNCCDRLRCAGCDSEHWVVIRSQEQLIRDADTIEKIVEEMMIVTKSERTTRVIDFDQDG